MERILTPLIKCLNIASSQPTPVNWAFSASAIIDILINYKSANAGFSPVIVLAILLRVGCGALLVSPSRFKA